MLLVQFKLLRGELGIVVDFMNVIVQLLYSMEGPVSCDLVVHSIGNQLQHLRMTFVPSLS